MIPYMREEAECEFCDRTGIEPGTSVCRECWHNQEYPDLVVDTWRLPEPEYSRHKWSAYRNEYITAITYDTEDKVPLVVLRDR